MATTPFNPTKYRGIEDYVCVSIVRDRDPTIADYRDPRTGRYYQQNTIWMNEVTESFFALARIVANEAQWIAFGTPASGLLATLTSNTGDVVTPDGAMNINVIGDTAQGVTGNGVDATATITMTVNDATTSTKGVAQFDPDDFVVNSGVVSLAPEIPITFGTDSGSAQADGNLIRFLGGEGIDTSGATNIVTISGELATAAATVGAANIGVAAYDSADFTVTAGFVSLKSGSSGVTTLTGDDSSAVPATGGNIDIQGKTVAAGASKALYFNGTPASSLMEAEIRAADSAAASPGDFSKVGICSFDSSAFSVDAWGHVTLAGGSGPAVDGITPQFNTAPGTDPVVPTGAGLITLSGTVVANATNLNTPVATHSRAANTVNVEVQASTAVSGTPGDAFDAGVASFETAQFSVNTSYGFVELKDPFLTNNYTNLGLDYTSPTLKVTSQDKTALSASNKAYVRINSKSNRGEVLTIPVTADVSMQDSAGTGDMNLNTFGTTSLVAWGDTLPLFLYAVLNDAETLVTFALSRVPHLVASPAVAKMAKQGSAVATTQGSMFVMDSSVAVGDYDSNPVVCLGAVNATKDAADAWKIGSFDNFTGLGNFAEAGFYVFPTTQMGADVAANSGLSSSVGGDTIPQFSSNGRVYQIHKTGMCLHLWGWNNITVAGVGTGNLRLHLPYVNGTSAWSYPSNYTYTSGANYYSGSFRSPTSTSYTTFVPSGSGVSLLTPGDVSGITNGQATIWYPTSRG